MHSMEFNLITLVVTTLAAYRVTRFLVEDFLFEPVRNWIWKKFPPSTKIGYLFTCYWCMSFWVAIKLVALSLLLPEFTFVVSLVLAISALVGLIQTRVER
jgi:hypothetical protein